MVSAGYRSWVDSRLFYTLPIALFVVNALGRSTKLDWLVTSTVQNVLIAVAIERTTRESGWMASLLGWRPLVVLGLWSYSVYLWQQPFLNRQDQDSWSTASPVNILMVLVAVAASYYLVERPALRLRERLEFASDRPPLRGT